MVKLNWIERDRRASSFQTPIENKEHSYIWKNIEYTHIHASRKTFICDYRSIYVTHVWTINEQNEIEELWETVFECDKTELL